MSLRNILKKIIISIIFAVIVISCILIPIYFGVKNKNDILGFTGAIIGIVCTYLIFCIQKHADNERSTNEIKQKLEYNKRMIYSLLKFSYVETNDSVNCIRNFYLHNFANLIDQNNVYLLNRYNLIGSILDDYGKITTIASSEHKNIYNNLLLQMSQVLFNDMKNKQISKRVIYIDTWYDYLEGIQEVEKNIIIDWITLIKNTDIQIDVIEFLKCRQEIFKIINLYYPNLPREDSRSLFRS